MSDAAEPGDFVEVPMQEVIDAGARKRHRDPEGVDQFALKAMERPNSSMVAAIDLPETNARSVAARRRYPYLTDDGRILVQRIRNGRKNAEGIHLVTLYFTWKPFPEVTEQ